MEAWLNCVVGSVLLGSGNQPESVCAKKYDKICANLALCKYNAQFGLRIVVTENHFECSLRFGMATYIYWYGWLCWPCLDGCFKFETGCFCSLIFFLASKGTGSKLEIKDTNL